MVELKRSRHYSPIQPHLIRCGSRPRPERSRLEGKPILRPSWTQRAPGPSFYEAFSFLSFIIQLSEVEVGLNELFFSQQSIYLTNILYIIEFSLIVVVYTVV